MRAETAKRLHDVLTACSKIQSFIGGVDLVTYESSDLIRSASERQLKILGEALNQARQHDPSLTNQTISSAEHHWHAESHCPRIQ